MQTRPGFGRIRLHLLDFGLFGLEPPASRQGGSIAIPPDAYDRILAALQRAALDDAHWPAASALIEEACGATGNILTVVKRFGRKVDMRFAGLLYRGEPREDLLREYFEVYAHRDEGPVYLMNRRVGQLFHATDIYTEREKRTSPAYNEAWGRMHGQRGLVSRIDVLDGAGVTWGVGNPVATAGWQSDQVRLIESLLPHVLHFVRVRQALAGAEALGAGLGALLDNSRIGIMQLDREGRVLAANAPARDLLRRGEALSDRGGALHASLPADDRSVQRLLKRALPVFGGAPPAGGSMTIQRPALRSRLEIHVHPVDAARPDFGARRAAALVLVVDPESRTRIDPVRLSVLLGLTPSEARVSALLAEGRPVREIAATAGFKESYVRFLFKQIYRKLDLSGQVALVQRVLTAYAFPRR